jgi:hypothetical protein
VPASSLLAAPFNIVWGSSIFAKVYATNIYGNSIESSGGNGAIILTNPDAPYSLEDVPTTTSGY